MEEYLCGVGVGGFDRSRERFDALVVELSGRRAGGLTHAELEDELGMAGRELIRMLLQDHLDLRAVREPRRESVTGSDLVVRTRVEIGHQRGLGTLYGEVEVGRLAYRSAGAPNLYPADAVLSLPAEKHSYGLRRLAAVEATRGSFQDASAAVERACGVRVGKRQVQALAQRAAGDIDAFYQQQRPGSRPVTDLLVLSADGKGIVMRPEALRAATARKAAAKGGNKMATRLSGGEKLGRKRMAEVGAVYDATPVPRQAGDVITTTAAAGTTATATATATAAAADGDRERSPRRKGPRAEGKWLTASVEASTAEVITTIFDEADRRDPDHQRTWVVLVDGHRHQLSLVHAEARRRKVEVNIVCDFVHVLEYLWTAAWCFHPQGDPAAERWVATQATKILHGRSSTVAATIRRTATTRGLSAQRRKGADKAADYLLAKKPYLAYHKALAAGWPIATGIIEGACRHLVKDRMDITGARWGLPGAEAVLKLRALHSNGDFDAYW
ncbi:MAG: ISKra4 family transposase, partial [Pseudonocardia sp.]